jgi:O-acetylhomoserine (thiol)-lyase
MSDADLAKSGITAGTVRLSIGLEALADLVEDLERALKAAARP